MAYYPKDIIVTCPKCGQTRVLHTDMLKRFSAKKADDGKYYGVGRCTTCGRREREQGKQYETKPFSNTWDHDPWESIRCEAVTANQLFDGWA